MVKFFERAGMVSGVSVRPGNMSYVHGDVRRTREDREAFLRRLDIPLEKLVCGRQVHGSVIREVFPQDRGKGAFAAEDSFPGTDGLVTRSPQVPLGVFTADCLSVFFHAPSVPCVGVVHAGWKSTREGITEKMVRHICAAFGARAEDISAGLGPCIRQCCYQVGEEFQQQFPEDVLRRQGALYFDLAGANRRQLTLAGVREENIEDCGECTVCTPQKFFSYRRESSACGRMMSAIMLR